VRRRVRAPHRGAPRSCKGSIAYYCPPPPVPPTPLETPGDDGLAALADSDVLTGNSPGLPLGTYHLPRSLTTVCPFLCSRKSGEVPAYSIHCIDERPRVGYPPP
jgi:hypothetical protein